MSVFRYDLSRALASIVALLLRLAIVIGLIGSVVAVFSWNSAVDIWWWAGVSLLLAIILSYYGDVESAASVPGASRAVKAWQAISSIAGARVKQRMETSARAWVGTVAAALSILVLVGVVGASLIESHTDGTFFWSIGLFGLAILFLAVSSIMDGGGG